MLPELQKKATWQFLSPGLPKASDVFDFSNFRFIGELQADLKGACVVTSLQCQTQAPSQTPQTNVKSWSLIVVFLIMSNSFLRKRFYVKKHKIHDKELS